MQTQPPPNPRRSEKQVILALVLLSLLLLAVALFLFARSFSSVGDLFSPSDRLRPWADSPYRKTVLESRPLVPLTTIAATSTSISHQSNHLILTTARGNYSGGYELPGTFPTAQTATSARLGTGTVELIATGMVDLSSLENPNRDYPVHYFSPAGQPLTTASLPRVARNKVWIGSYQHNPQFSAILQLPSSDYQILESNIYDARTHARLSNGNGWWTQNQVVGIQTEIGAWSSRSIQLVLRIARIGPAQDLPFTTGSLVRTSTSAVRVMLVGGSGHIGGWSVGEKVDLNITTYSTPTQFGILECFPAWASSAVQIKLLAADGKVIEGGNNGSSGNFKLIEGRDPGRPNPRRGTLPIKTLRLQFPEEITVIKFDLPAIYGLPTNQPANLFDQVIPYVKFDQPYQLKQFIENNAQVQIGPSPTTYAKFSLELRNVTLARLLDEYEKLCGAKLELDPSSMAIVVQRTTWDRIHTWLKSQIPWLP